MHVEMGKGWRGLSRYFMLWSGSRKKGIRYSFPLNVGYARGGREDGAHRLVRERV